MLSVDFGMVERLQHDGDRATPTEMMRKQLGVVAADFVLPCANTVHVMDDPIADSVSIPMLHIVDPTAAVIVAYGHRRVGLIGTAFPMEEAFYCGRLTERFGFGVIVPDIDDRA